MYQIRVCQSVSGTGSLIVTETLAVLYSNVYPENLDAILNEFGGDFIDVVCEEEDNDEFQDD